MSDIPEEARIYAKRLQEEIQKGFKEILPMKQEDFSFTIAEEVINKAKDKVDNEIQ